MRGPTIGSKTQDTQRRGCSSHRHAIGVTTLSGRSLEPRAIHGPEKWLLFPLAGGEQTEFGLQLHRVSGRPLLPPERGFQIPERSVNSTVREHRWTIVDTHDAGIVARLSREINVPEPIARVLVIGASMTTTRQKRIFALR